jgi:hypothetical protein
VADLIVDDTKLYFGMRRHFKFRISNGFLERSMWNTAKKNHRCLRDFCKENVSEISFTVAWLCYANGY